MKKTASFLLIAVLAVVFITFASFIKYKDVSSYDIVSGIAIDFQNNEWNVVCEICLPSSNNDFSSRAQYVNGKGFTLKKALNDAALRSSNILYTDSVQLYLVGAKASELNELQSYLKSEKSNLRAVAVVTEGKASDVLRDEKEANERAKSLSLADKLKSICTDRKLPLPHVMNFIKNGGPLYITVDGLAERRM